MKKKILIIRSISMQQLDNLMSKLYTEYPDADFFILTHSHAIKRCGKYKKIAGIIDYKSSKNFGFFHIPENINKYNFYIRVCFLQNFTKSSITSTNF